MLPSVTSFAFVGHSSNDLTRIRLLTLQRPQRFQTVFTHRVYVTCAKTHLDGHLRVDLPFTLLPFLSVSISFKNHRFPTNVPTVPTHGPRTSSDLWVIWCGVATGNTGIYYVLSWFKSNIFIFKRQTLYIV